MRVRVRMRMRARIRVRVRVRLGRGHLVRGGRLAAAAGGQGHRCGRVDLDRTARAVGDEGRSG